MNVSAKLTGIKKWLLAVALLGSNFLAHSQSVDTTNKPLFIRGQITLTNNGVSLIPNFSLNKPALLNDLSIGKGRMSFDPMFRFNLNGQPWAFVFWFRYKAVDTKKWALTMGAHPSFIFRNETATIQGVTRTVMTTQRYVAWEVAPTHLVNKRLAWGLYYLGARGVTKDLIQWGNFMALRAILANWPVGRKFNLTMVPQIYFLQQDDRSGAYWNANFGLAKNNFPLTLSAIISQTIQSEIAGKKFIWSIGLVYNLNSNYYPLLN